MSSISLGNDIWKLGDFRKPSAAQRGLATSGESSRTISLPGCRATLPPGEPFESTLMLLVELHRRATSPRDLVSTAEALHTTRDRLRNETRSVRVDIWCHLVHQADGHGRRLSGSQSKLYLIDPLLGDWCQTQSQRLVGQNRRSRRPRPSGWTGQTVRSASLRATILTRRSTTSRLRPTT